LASAAGFRLSSASCNGVSRNTGWVSRRTFPVVIREYRGDPTSWFCAVALRSMISTARVRLSIGIAPLRSIREVSQIALNGVRSSCQTRQRRPVGVQPGGASYG
jgi:hypothetical protein